jgi:hypothetical protein
VLERRSWLRAPRPVPIPPALIDLAAGRSPDELSLDERLIDVAAEHRMTGLLWSWVSEQALASEETTKLAVWDLTIQAHQARVASVLESCLERLSAVGIDVATIKGVTAEERWYERRGERPCSDVDLLMAPDQVDRTPELVALLQPDHPWLPHLGEMVAARQIQSVTLNVEALEVDVHLDLLKLGVWMRDPAAAWSSTTYHTLRGGRRVRVLDDTWALFHFLVHLNKDRFQRLLGYADVVRIVKAGHVDWPRLHELAETEGLAAPISLSLDAVLEDLGMRPGPASTSDQRVAPPVPSGTRLVWKLFWGRRVRLRGVEGRLRYRHRQNLIVMVSRGRMREAIDWWFREVFPPAPAVEDRYAHIPGPYAWKLARGRVAEFGTKRTALSGRRRR